MKIPQNAHVPKDKLNKYLLVPKKENDKSKFLSQAGFSLQNPEELEKALRKHIEEHDAIPDKENEYGEFYTVKGDLEGSNGTFLKIISIHIFIKILLYIFQILIK